MKYEWSKLWQNVMLKKIIGLLFVLNIVILVYNVTQQEYKQNYLVPFSQEKKSCSGMDQMKMEELKFLISIGKIYQREIRQSKY